MNLFVIFSGHAKEQTHVRICNLLKVECHWHVKPLIPCLLLHVVFVMDQHSRALLDPVNLALDDGRLV